MRENAIHIVVRGYETLVAGATGVLAGRLVTQMASTSATTTTAQAHRIERLIFMRILKFREARPDISIICPRLDECEGADCGGDNCYKADHDP